MARHFLDLSDAGGDAISAMLNDAIDRKAGRASWRMAMSKLTRVRVEFFSKIIPST